MPTELDETLIFVVSSSGSRLRLFKTTMGTIFELYHPNPPNPNSPIPNLRMYEDPGTKDIFYMDQAHNYYKPIPPEDLSAEEAMGWFPYLSRMNLSTYQPLVIHRPAGITTPETRPTPSGTTSLNEQEAPRPTHSHPPGFEPKMLSQTINQGNHAGYAEYPVEELRT